MAHIKINPTTLILGGKLIKGVALEGVVITPVNERADIIASQDGSISKYADVVQLYTMTLPVQVGGEADNYFKSLSRGVQNSLTGSIEFSGTDETGNISSTRYQIYNFVVQNFTSQDVSNGVANLEQQSFVIYNIKFAGERG